MGGLVSSIILAKEGLKVCVLGKNNQYGGNLQTFVRDKVIFDTGVHYIGGLEKGQNLYQYFKYLGIIDGLRLKRMDKDAYDYITFDGDPNKYPHARSEEHTSELQSRPHLVCRLLLEKKKKKKKTKIIH